MVWTYMVVFSFKVFCLLNSKVDRVWSDHFKYLVNCEKTSVIVWHMLPDDDCKMMFTCFRKRLFIAYESAVRTLTTVLSKEIIQKKITISYVLSTFPRHHLHYAFVNGFGCNANALDYHVYIANTDISIRK